MEVIKRRTHNKGIPTPTFESDAHAFFTTFRNMNYGLEASDFLKLLGDQGELVESIPKEEKYTKSKKVYQKEYTKTFRKNCSAYYRHDGTRSYIHNRRLRFSSTCYYTGN